MRRLPYKSLSLQVSVLTSLCPYKSLSLLAAANPLPSAGGLTLCGEPTQACGSAPPEVVGEKDGEGRHRAPLTAPQ